MKIEKQIKKKKFCRVRLGLFERARPVTLRETCVFGLCFFFIYKGWITYCLFFFFCWEKQTKMTDHLCLF
jgi:hypothetical protein